MAVGVSSTSPTVDAGRSTGRSLARRDAEAHAAALAEEVAVEVDGVLFEQVTDEAEAVGVHAGRVDADEDVALLDELRSPELVALGEADGEAGHVEVAVRELARVLGGLAAEQHAPGPQAALVDAGDDVGDLLGHDLADHQVVEEEERDGAAGGDVVDAHRHEVDADGVEPAHAAGDLDLGADAVGAGDEHGVLELRQAHGAAETAEAAEDERVLRALEPLLHELDGAVARLDVDAGLLVGEPLLVRHAAPRSPARPSLRPASVRLPVPGRFRWPPLRRTIQGSGVGQTERHALLVDQRGGGLKYRADWRRRRYAPKYERMVGCATHGASRRRTTSYPAARCGGSSQLPVTDAAPACRRVGSATAGASSAQASAGSGSSGGEPVGLRRPAARLRERRRRRAPPGRRTAQPPS